MKGARNRPDQGRTGNPGTLNIVQAQRDRTETRSKLKSVTWKVTLLHVNMWAEPAAIRVSKIWLNLEFNCSIEVLFRK